MFLTIGFPKFKFRDEILDRMVGNSQNQRILVIAETGVQPCRVLLDRSVFDSEH